MTPSDTIIVYKVSSFLCLYSDFWYNSLGSTCTCRYLNVGTNVSQRASSLKLNFRFVGSPTVLHWEGHNSSIRSAIEVNEHLMESLFDKLSNRSSLILISCRQGLQTIKIFSSEKTHQDILSLFLPEATLSSWACYSSLGPWSKWEHTPRTWRTHQGSPWTSSSLATTIGGQQGRLSQTGGPVQFEFESSSAFKTSL
jgi:hypothetical protein